LLPNKLRIRVSKHASPQSPLQCLNPLLLLALVQMNVFNAFLAPGEDLTPQTIVDPAEVSHEVVEQCLESKTESLAGNMSSRLEEALRNIKFDYDRHEARDSAYEFFGHVFTKLTEAGSLRAFDTSKAVIEQLTPKLQPRIVSEIVKDCKYRKVMKRMISKRFRSNLSRRSS
jgi:hypothetical protein